MNIYYQPLTNFKASSYAVLHSFGFPTMSPGECWNGMQSSNFITFTFLVPFPQTFTSQVELLILMTSAGQCSVLIFTYRN